MSWMSRHFWNIKNWHWVSSAVCLIGMLLFAITGITLNHAGQIEAQPQVNEVEAFVPENILAQLVPDQPLTDDFRQWYKENTGMTIPSDTAVQWSDNEIYAAMPRPGGDRWFSVVLANGEFYQESTNRGWLAYLNDLHKGRNTGVLWSWFIDLFSVACIIFSLTGLLLLKRYAKGRKSTWPLVIAGLLIPVALLLFPAFTNADELKVTIPRLKVAEYHAPYVAIWLADDKDQRVKDIAVWYDVALADKEGEKWLKDLRMWWRRSGRSAQLPIDGVSGATRRPGTVNVDISNAIAGLPEGNYTLYVEAARELGGRELLSIELQLPLTQKLRKQAKGENELSSIELIMEPSS